MTREQEWFRPLVVGDDYTHDTLAYQTTCVFFVSIFQYLFLCISFAISKPFRKPMYTNIWFMISILTLFGFDLYLLFADKMWSNNRFGIFYGYDPNEDPTTDPYFGLYQAVPMSFRGHIAVVVIINVAAIFFYEKIFIWYLTLWIKKREDRKKEQDQKKRLEELQEKGPYKSSEKDLLDFDASKLDNFQQNL